MAEGVPQDVARLLAEDAVTGVDGVGALLHQQPGRAAAEGAGPVGAEGGVGGGVDARRGGVVVDGDQVDLAAECPQVQVLVGGQHEVGGHRAVAVGADRVALLAVGGERLVGPVAAEVQGLAGVAVPLAGAGRQDLLPGGVALAPECRPPGLVEGVERAVAGAQPDPEGGRGVIAPAEGRVLIVYVPQGERRMVAVAFGECAGDAPGGPAVGGGGEAVGVPAAVGQSDAVAADRQGVRVGQGEPGGGEAVGVARSTATPFACRRSRWESSQPKS